MQHCTRSKELPRGFMYLDEVCGDVDQSIMFATKNNFTGKRVDGYYSNKAILTNEAANALQLVQNDLKKVGYKLRIYDAYRPIKAVEAFLAWKKIPENLNSKRIFYPNLSKSDLFEQGFIAPAKSSHSRGSTIDLTLVDIRTGRELDMGSSLGCFTKESRTDYKYLTTEEKSNRSLLLYYMKKYNFKNLDIEWWHFTLKNEPFPDSYFDFDVV